MCTLIYCRSVHQIDKIWNIKEISWRNGALHTGVWGYPNYKGEKDLYRPIIRSTIFDAVPFYCSLCHFMGKMERNVVKYAKGYRPHKLAEEKLKAQGKDIESITTYIHKNPNPLKLGESHEETNW